MSEEGGEAKDFIVFSVVDKLGVKTDVASSLESNNSVMA